MQKRTFLLRTLAAGGLALGLAFPAAAQWKPTKPINLIVPWAAGGSTDQVTRVGRDYPHLTDDAFVREHLDRWLA